MLVERLESADKCTRILQNDPNPVIQVLDHFIVLADRLEETRFCIIEATDMFSRLTMIAALVELWK